jgi:hypothetical protein
MTGHRLWIVLHANRDDDIDIAAGQATASVGVFRIASIPTASHRLRNLLDPRQRTA